MSTNFFCCLPRIDHIGYEVVRMVDLLEPRKATIKKFPLDSSSLKSNISRWNGAVGYLT